MKIATLSKYVFLFSFLLGTVLSANAYANNGKNDLEKLRFIQRKVQNTVAKNMETCVAITDGAGFGSGVIVSPDGLILTAGHVMGSGSAGREYEIIFASGRIARARALGKNLNVDAGMLQLIGQGPWPYVELAENDAEVGDWVVNLGHSGGYELGRKPPVRTGRVLDIRGEQLVSDAVLIGGDSGGPLFNLDSELIGIHSSIGDSVAENRHVTISTFREHWGRMERGESWGKLPELTSGGKKRKTEPAKQRAKLGVVVDRAVTDSARIAEVRANSPAERVGIRAGDVVKLFEGQVVRDSQHLIDLVKAKAVGDTVTLTVVRGGYELNYQIILDELN
jgi:serine protease Do